MEERLVDVLNDKNTVLHVFPVKVKAHDAPLGESDFEQAVKAAVAAEIVPPTEAKKLKARRHVSRGGPLTPYGDALQIKHEQQMRLEHRIRERAYFLWQEAGCPDNQVEEHWHRAKEVESTSAD